MSIMKINKTYKKKKKKKKKIQVYLGWGLSLRRLYVNMFTNSKLCYNGLINC